MCLQGRCEQRTLTPTRQESGCFTSTPTHAQSTVLSASDILQHGPRGLPFASLTTSVVGSPRAGFATGYHLSSKASVHLLPVLLSCWASWGHRASESHCTHVPPGTLGMGCWDEGRF